jgi:hypothetical protein
VNEYAIGDDNGGYGIFPGSFAAAPIAVNPTTGMVDNWNVAGYSPVAPAGDPDALPGIGTTGVTIEMGSLYDTAAPGSSGILCSVTMEGAGDLCVAANAIRGNVVLESAAEVQNLVLPDCVTYGSGCNFPASNTTYNDWVTYGKPECWCNPYQCDGDTDGATQGLGKYRVFTNDLQVLIDNWQKKIGDNPNPCGDVDHKPQGLGKYRIFTNDLQVLIDNWQKKDGGLPGDCPRPE